MSDVIRPFSKTDRSRLESLRVVANSYFIHVWVATETFFLKAVHLNRGAGLPRGCQQVSRGRETLRALQHGMFDQ